MNASEPALRGPRRSTVGAASRVESLRTRVVAGMGQRDASGGVDGAARGIRTLRAGCTGLRGGFGRSGRGPQCCAGHSDAPDGVRSAARANRTLQRASARLRRQIGRSERAPQRCLGRLEAASTPGRRRGTSCSGMGAYTSTTEADGGHFSLRRAAWAGRSDSEPGQRAT